MHETRQISKCSNIPSDHCIVICIPFNWKTPLFISCHTIVNIIQKLLDYNSNLMDRYRAITITLVMMAQRLARRDWRSGGPRFKSHPRLTFQSWSSYQLNQLGIKACIRFDLKTVDYLRGIEYLYFTLLTCRFREIRKGSSFLDILDKNLMSIIWTTSWVSTGARSQSSTKPQAPSIPRNIEIHEMLSMD